jgi:nanoRNase/pAp phosphatase (c-di-AMP/oligoRNAs hydrolase)
MGENITCIYHGDRCLDGFAEQFNGGGHPNAAGFQLTQEQVAVGLLITGLK